MDSWHEDIKTDDMSQEFLRFFRALMPNDRDLFYKLLEEEYKEIKKTQEMSNSEQEQTNEFIGNVQQEIQEIKTQAETNAFINDIKQEVAKHKNLLSKSHKKRQSISMKKSHDKNKSLCKTIKRN